MRRPSQASLASFIIPYSVRNSFAYAETVTLACTGRPENAKLYQCLRISQSTCRSRWMVYLFVIFMYSALVALPSNYRDRTFVSPFLRHLCVLLQRTDATCPPELGAQLFDSVPRVVQSARCMWLCDFWTEMGLSKLVFSNNYCIYVIILMFLFVEIWDYPQNETNLG